jgi:hypothetical protein
MRSVTTPLPGVKYPVPARNFADRLGVNVPAKDSPGPASQTATAIAQAVNSLGLKKVVFQWPWDPAAPDVSAQKGLMDAFAALGIKQSWRMWYPWHFAQLYATSGLPAPEYLVSLNEPLGFYKPATTAELFTGTFRDTAWSSGTTYAANEHTIIGGVAYRSRVGGNLNHTPPGPTVVDAWWEPAWLSGVTQMDLQAAALITAKGWTNTKIVGPAAPNMNRLLPNTDISDEVHPYNHPAKPIDGSPFYFPTYHVNQLHRSNWAGKGHAINCTESGWAGGPAASGAYCPPEAQRDLVLRVLVDVIRNPAIRDYYVWELMDQPGLASWSRLNMVRASEELFGILNADLSDKPAATAIRRLMALMADDAAPASFRPAPIDVRTAGGSYAIQTAVFGKANGTTLVAFWDALEVTTALADKNGWQGNSRACGEQGDFPHATIPAGVSSSATTFTISSAANLVGSAPYTLWLDGNQKALMEAVTVTSIVGTTITCTRGAKGTTARAHGTNCPVTQWDDWPSGPYAPPAGVGFTVTIPNKTWSSVKLHDPTVANPTVLATSGPWALTSQARVQILELIP